MTMAKPGIKTYRDLARTMDFVLCNEIVNYHELEPVNGADYYEEDGEIYYYDIFQFFIISDCDADFLSRSTDEIVYYCSDLDVYVWGVTHFGTAWDYVEFNNWKE